MRKFAMAFLVATIFASLPAVAQQGGGSGGANSEVSACQSKLEMHELRAKAMVDKGRQAEVMQTIAAAKQAQMSGNATKCLIELGKIDN